MIDGRILLKLGGDRRLHRRHVLAVDVQYLGLPLESLGDARASRFERDLTLLLDDAYHLLGAVLVEAFARGDPKLLAFAILGAANWITRWFDPRGAASSDEIGQAFADYLLAGLRA